jgi:hypothetical protein
MALPWAAAGMMEAQPGFRRLKAHRQLPALRLALAITISCIWKIRMRSGLLGRPHVTSKLPDDDFLLRANYGLF